MRDVILTIGGQNPSDPIPGHSERMDFCTFPGSGIGSENRR